MIDPEILEYLQRLEKKIDALPRVTEAVFSETISFPGGGVVYFTGTQRERDSLIKGYRHRSLNV